MNKNITASLKLLIALLIFGYLALAYVKSMKQTTAKINDMKALEKRLTRLSEENAVLKQEIKNLQKPEEIERQARNLGLVKQNELSLRVIDKKQKKKQKTTAGESP